MLRVDERSPIEWSRELDAAALGFIPHHAEMSLPAVLRRPTNSAGPEIIPLRRRWPDIILTLQALRTGWMQFAREGNKIAPPIV
jgi:hypothetical protein